MIAVVAVAAAAVLVVVVIGVGVLIALMRSNFLTPAGYERGTGQWQTAVEDWCPDGETMAVRGTPLAGQRWLTFERSYARVIVAGGEPDGPFAYTLFTDVPAGPEGVPSAVWADTDGNGRFHDSDGPLHYAVMCPGP